MKSRSNIKPEIAIIGYGRFGKLAAHYLKKDFKVYASDSRNIRPEKGIRRVSLQVAAQKKNILLAVPMNQMKSVLYAIVPLLQQSAFICDVCSVKELPIRWMKEILPKHVTILGTHPLFGPDSAANGFRGKTIVVCPARISQGKLTKIKKLFTNLGLIVHQTTPKKHDQLMASTLFLSQFIGRAVYNMQLPSTKISTHNFKLLQDIAKTSHNDSIKLFRDMFQHNRFTRIIPKQILKQLEILSRELTKQ